MTTTINAKSTGIGGLDVTCDASGSLCLQTGGVTALTIDTSQNVGIGTTSPRAGYNLTLGNGGSSNAALNIDGSSSSALGAGIRFARGGTATGYIGTASWLVGGTSSDLVFSANSSATEAMRIDSSGNVGINKTPNAWGSGFKALQISDVTSLWSNPSVSTTYLSNNLYYDGSVRKYITSNYAGEYQINTGGYHVWFTAPSGSAGGTISLTEVMRLDNSGNLLVGTTDSSPAGNNGTGISLETFGSIQCSRSGGTTIHVNRKTNDGDLMSFRQDGTQEGTISVSGTTVSYNGGHLSRWSQWQNETGKPSIYRGTILESTNDMCEWEKDGEPLPNEQATKTIVSTTVASKAVAGVFDRYDEDDETNPYDFYVAQSGDFVIRIAQGVVVQNGDLLESAGDGTAKPQADDICRSSTVAKVTSNYVSATYEDGSYCVPCILMIG